MQIALRISLMGYSAVWLAGHLADFSVALASLAHGLVACGSRLAVNDWSLSPAVSLIIKALTLVKFKSAHSSQSHRNKIITASVCIVLYVGGTRDYYIYTPHVVSFIKLAPKQALIKENV